MFIYTYIYKVFYVLNLLLINRVIVFLMNFPSSVKNVGYNFQWPYNKSSNSVRNSVVEITVCWMIYIFLQV